MVTAPLRNFEGKIVGASKIARDITDKKQAETRSELLAERWIIEPRTCSAIVQAAVHLTKADSAKQMKVAIEGRIRALASAHGLSSESRWQGADLRRLIMEELAPYRQEQESRAEVKGGRITHVDADIAVLRPPRTSCRARVTGFRSSTTKCCLGRGSGLAIK